MAQRAFSGVISLLYWQSLMMVVLSPKGCAGEDPDYPTYTETAIAEVPVFRMSLGPKSADINEGHRDWVLKLPGDWGNREVTDFAQGLPKGCIVTFQGHPSDGGLSLVGLRATDAHLEYLLDGSSVEYVQEDAELSVGGAIEEDAPAPPWRPAQIEAGEGGWVQLSPPSWGLERVDQRSLPLNGTYTWRGSGGAGVHIYIFDTGILTTHQDFQGRAVPTLDVTSGQLDVCDPWNRSCALDVNGHGTFCAGVAGGATYGVSKNAVLHSVKVLNDHGKGSGYWFLEGLDWVAVNGQRPSIVSASLGGRGNSPIMQDSIAQAVTAGITAVVSAGNSRDDACQYSPASVTTAITVASTDRHDQMSNFSNFGPCVDIFAPGTSIVSAWADSDVASATLSGTSMACPHVAGAAALILGETPTFTAKQVADALYLRSTKSAVEDAGDTPNRLLYTLEPAHLAGVCCHVGQGCFDDGKACNQPGAWCSRSEDNCMGHCRGKFFCPSSES
mmetsp:Transcript_153754/g.373324  ORF Transcript_153754/g.373324 Transcript_153754/m.373324 type:complete len:501 (-) Transcript_153754:252-1754(-)